MAESSPAPAPPATWPRSAKEAAKMQRAMAGRVRRAADPARPFAALRRVAGMDVSYDRATDRCHAAIVTVDRETLETLEEAAISAPCVFPYVPGLLSFREAPPLLEAFARLRGPVDVLLVDAQGIAHPRRFGLASHLGVWLGLPSVGCAKTRLIGEFEPPGNERGARSELRDPKSGEVIGAALRARAGVAPVFVSIGHLVSLDEAVALALSLAPRFRLPEPIRRAHALSNRQRLGEVHP